MDQLGAFIIIGFIVFVGIWICVASKFEYIANEKGYSGYFWWVLLLGIIGIAMVVALPDRYARGNSVSALTYPGSDTSKGGNSDSALIYPDSDTSKDGTDDYMYLPHFSDLLGRIGTCPGCGAEGVSLADTDYGTMCLDCYKNMGGQE